MLGAIQCFVGQISSKFPVNKGGESYSDSVTGLALEYPLSSVSALPMPPHLCYPTLTSSPAAYAAEKLVGMGAGWRKRARETRSALSPRGYDASRLVT